jgi:vancomycin resistance protein VanJ
MTFGKWLRLVYLSAILIWFGLWAVVQDGNWWMALLSHAVPFLCAPSLVVLFAALRDKPRRARWFGLALIPVLIFTALFWPYVLPRRAPSLAQTDLRVMTYNVLFSNTDADAIARNILHYKPDLVALQEVLPPFFAKLRNKLIAEYSYFIVGEANTFGTTAIFSRHPFASSRVVSLNSDRPALIVEIKLGNRVVTFANAHLLAFGLSWRPLRDVPAAVTQLNLEQQQQARTVLNAIKDADTAIFACDCNVRDPSSVFRFVSTEMRSASREFGWAINAALPPGAHLDTDLQHLDYVFYRGKLRLNLAYSVSDSGGSDHLPLVAEFGFQ